MPHCEIHGWVGQGAASHNFRVEIQAEDGSEHHTEDVKLCHACQVKQMELFLQAMPYTARKAFVAHIRARKLYLSDVPTTWHALEPSISEVSNPLHHPART